VFCWSASSIWSDSSNCICTGPSTITNLCVCSQFQLHQGTTVIMHDILVAFISNVFQYFMRCSLFVMKAILLLDHTVVNRRNYTELFFTWCQPCL